MSSFAKALFETLHFGSDDKQITRVDSPKITMEPKSKDFDTSSVRSPGAVRKTGKKVVINDSHAELSPAATERAFNIRYQIENANFAKGAYGKVELALDKMTKEKVAIKRIPKSTPIKMINAEVKAGQTIGTHPQIATFHKYHDFGDHHTLVFQFVDGKDLFTHLEDTNFEPTKEVAARQIVKDIAQALHHCHEKNIAHRDLKLENVLLTKDGRGYLIDFGLCSFIEEGKKSREWCGSDNYICPQIVRRESYDGKLADVFSLGVVAFALLFGVFPFENLRVNSRYSNDPSRPLPMLRVRFPVDVKISLEAKDLLIGMLEDDPSKRCSMAEVLSHEWFREDNEPLLSKESNE